MPCQNFTCGNAAKCRKCWAAAFHPDVAKSLGREVQPLVIAPAQPNLCRSCPPPTAHARGVEYRKAADRFVEGMRRFLPEPAAGRFAGRGITIAAGGKYWASTYVTIRMIRHVGCTLPIQIWYLGASGERDERYERLLAPFGVEFVDIDTHPAHKERRGVNGFQCKLFAVINSPFEEVLSIDPDAYTCADPTPLFDLPAYRTLGGIYWPDLPHTNAWTDWTAADVSPRGPCGLETGTYVLHKRTAWQPLLLAEWYDDRPEWTYGNPGPAGGLDHGDKGSHRLAWAKLERDYVVFNSTAAFEKFAFVQPGPDGQPMFVHRCLSKLVAEGPIQFATTQQAGHNLRGRLPGESEAFGFLDDLLRQLKERP